ncbi:hypothetical protein ABTZ92_24750 [Streptomyces albidoflavus]|uniref:hypothetical protein n=1 Tax=Streptomyces albidoflavus TaxID=1886 RepID=UPI00332AAEFF
MRQLQEGDRGPWAAGARRTDAPFHEAELLLSDPAEHEHQATTRTMDTPGLPLDTAGKPPEHTIKDNSSPISSPSGARGHLSSPSGA